MGSKYYESELLYLREMGREFAEVHPATAGLLAAKGGDPDVERLLEGFAFLTARVRERADDAVPDVVHGLMQLLLPHYLRPIPAMSVIQYSPSIRALRGVHQVKRGTRVASKRINGTVCEFRTAQDVALLPLELEDAQLDETRANNPVIRLRFATSEAGREVISRAGGFEIMLAGEQSLAGDLMLWFHRYLTDVTFQCEGSDPVSLGAHAMQPVPHRAERAVLPWPTLAHEGYRSLQEFFALPEKFNFIGIKGLDAVSVSADTFELSFTFERPPELSVRISPTNFRLFCTPVVNLFETSGEPVKRNPKVHEHLLRASGIEPLHAEVYAVREVIGIRQGQAKRRAYEPFVGYGHTADTEEGTYYTLRPTVSPLDDGIDTYVSIVTPLGETPLREEETLSFELTCTNRSLPSELQLGEVNTSPRGVSSPAPFKNIVPVTNANRPKLGSELLWRLLSHLSLGRSSLARPEVLRGVLGLYNFQKESSPARGRANERKVEAIRAINSKPLTRLVSGAPVRGVLTTIEVEEAKVGSVGESFMLGSILDEIFATHVPLNSFNELHLHLHPSKVELRWPARSGLKPIL